ARAGRSRLHGRGSRRLGGRRGAGPEGKVAERPAVLRRGRGQPGPFPVGAGGAGYRSRRRLQPAAPRSTIVVPSRARVAGSGTGSSSPLTVKAALNAPAPTNLGDEAARGRPVGLEHVPDFLGAAGLEDAGAALGGVAEPLRVPREVLLHLDQRVLLPEVLANEAHVAGDDPRLEVALALAREGLEGLVEDPGTPEGGAADHHRDDAGL